MLDLSEVDHYHWKWKDVYARHLQESLFLDDFLVKTLSERAKWVKKYKNLETERMVKVNSGMVKVNSGMKLHKQSSRKHFCLSS